jgi:hypothetical protein
MRQANAPALLAALSALALAASPAGGLAAGPELSVQASLDADDPRAETLSAWTAGLPPEVGMPAGVEFLGGGAVAGARVAMAEPDGLTLGFLGLDEAVTRPLQLLAPYEPQDLEPALLFPGGAPALLYRGDGPEVRLAEAAGSPGAAVRLLVPTLRPVPGPVLLALDAIAGLGARPEFREIPAAPEGGDADPDGGPGGFWARAYLALAPGELLPVPWDGLAAIRAQGHEPGVALVLADPPAGGRSGAAALPPSPAGPLFSDLGLSHTVRELYGFYYPADTFEAVREGVPQALASLVGGALRSPQGVPFVTGAAVEGEAALEAYGAETEARQALLGRWPLTGGGGR